MKIMHKYCWYFTKLLALTVSAESTHNKKSQLFFCLHSVQKVLINLNSQLPKVGVRHHL